MSKRFYQRGDSGVAYKIIPSQRHRGLAITNKLKKELKRDLHIEEDYARLYAICIYYLIRDKLDSFDNLVTCNDENYLYVKEYLDLLFLENKKYPSKYITSLSRLRKLAGDAKIRSYADNTANIYRRKALKPLRRIQKGVKLSIVKINYQKIKEKWIEINNKIA